MDLLNLYNSEMSLDKVRTWFVRHIEDDVPCCVLNSSINELLSPSQTLGKTRLRDAIEWVFDSGNKPYIVDMKISQDQFLLIVEATMNDEIVEVFHLSIAKEF